MEPVGGSGERIGATERDEAVEALRAHLEAGRLTPEEYEDRTVTASGARTWDDLVPLFTDLPAPRPAPVTSAIERTGTSPGRLPALPDAVRERIMALTPFVALVLFFVTKRWWWFLAIPMVGALLYGSERKDRGRRRDRDRDRG